MSKYIVGAVAFFLNIAFCHAAFAEKWPSLSAGSGGVCEQGLEIAVAAFKSNAPYLYSPPTLPEEFGSKLLLSPEAVDISGGDALVVDEDYFVKIEAKKSAGIRNIFWQRKSKNNNHIVVVEVPHGWRGDLYSTYYLSSQSKLESLSAATDNFELNEKLRPSIPSSWRPPLILQEKALDQLWVVDVGNPYQWLANWSIYGAGEGNLQLLCVVRFHPDAKNPLDLLPKSIRLFAKTLDKTIGTGLHDGTLQSTAKLRGDIQNAWANVALRPWALEQPRNTRMEVEKNLNIWAARNSFQRSLYRRIQRQYLEAEKSLAIFYENSFSKESALAKRLARYSLDVIFRHHYVFPSEGGVPITQDSLENPWRIKN